MNEKPILFKGDMVRAILEGRKTETRRIIKNVTINDWDKNDPNYGPFTEDQYGDHHKTADLCPYGQIGDRLWVRETWRFLGGKRIGDSEEITIEYKDGIIINHKTEWKFGRDIKSNKWKPSIHMPRVVSRITLEIIDIKVERVQDITEEGAFAEGIGVYYKKDSKENHYAFSDGYTNYYAITGKKIFEYLWDSINKKRGFSWDSNPWIWVVKFKRII
jgi:hypothetical protein